MTESPAPALPAARLAFLACLVAWLVAGLSSCAGTTEMPGSTPEARIVVDNTRAGVTGRTVYLVSPGRQPIRLGDLELNRKKEFTVRQRGLLGRYRLILGTPRRVRMASRWFDLNEGDRVEWDLDDNQVLFQGNVSGR